MLLSNIAHSLQNVFDYMKRLPDQRHIFHFNTVDKAIVLCIRIQLILALTYFKQLGEYIKHQLFFQNTVIINK